MIHICQSVSLPTHNPPLVLHLNISIRNWTTRKIIRNQRTGLLNTFKKEENIEKLFYKMICWGIPMPSVPVIEFFSASYSIQNFLMSNCFDVELYQYANTAFTIVNLKM